jgi:diguanylate cyclase (GGDEF)-like protein
MSASFFNRRPSRALAHWAMSAGFAFASLSATAACLPSADREIQEYEQRIGSDPAAVAKAVSARLDSAIDTDKSYRAALYAVLTESLGALERYEEVRVAAQQGIELLNDKRSPIHVNLLHQAAGNTYDDVGVKRAIAQVEESRKAQSPNSPAEACLLIALGQLEHQVDRVDQASIYLTRAYRMSVGVERTRQRVLAADTLSIVMRDVHEFTQALALNQEVIDWDAQRGAKFNLATSRFMRGAILRETGDHKAAIAELEASRELSYQMNDSFGIAYDNLLMCTSNIELGLLKTARSQCDQALQTFTKMDSVEPQKQALAALAQIDLTEGNAVAALTKLDRVLDQEGRDIVVRRLAHLYELRAKTYSVLGQHQKALADYRVHMQRAKVASDAERTREASAIRARFETDREIERNAFLQRELELQNERLAAQSERLRLMIIVAALGAVMIALLTYLLFTNRKQKQMLARLALHDDLTDLPNRRHTLDLANEAFQRARREGTSLTIGLLDLDHFKNINDRYGHAIGDFVLQEFAQVGRGSIREGDIFGRWGGEEFLIVLPDTTLDVALGIVERVREEALHIKGGSVADDLKVSLSAGLATNEGNPSRLDEIIACADAALYDAKKGGRDLVCIAPESYSTASTGVRRILKNSGIELITGKFERRTPAESRTNSG